MKTKILPLIAGAGLLLAGCDNSGTEHQSGAPAPEVKGQAITKLQDAEPEPLVKKADEAKPAAFGQAEVGTDTTADIQPEALKPAPDKPVQVAALTKKDPITEAKPAPKPEEKGAPVAAPAPKAKAEEKKDEQPAPAEKKGEPELIDGEFQSVTFDKLASFEYEVPEEEYDPDKKPDPKDNPDQIPAEIKAFNKKRVALKGFMLPLKVEDGLITELLVMRDQSMCCYGTVPKINEWVSVRMTGKGVKPIMDQAITIYGLLKVGEIRENGYLVGIYEMDGEKLTGPLDL